MPRQPAFRGRRATGLRPSEVRRKRARAARSGNQGESGVRKPLAATPRVEYNARLECYPATVSEAGREVPATPSGAQPPGVSVPFGATVTIFFSDIRGFTEYTNQYGDEAAWRVLRQHNALVSKQIELFGGRVVKTQGDSFMVYFST